MAAGKDSPGMRLFWCGLVSTLCGALFQFVGFVSPYWYQSWRRVHSSLANTGLWHICLSGYVKPRDPNMQSYVGCWWIHSTFFDDVQNFIMPPWFRGCQALACFELICNLVVLLLLILYLVEDVRRKIYADRYVLMFIIISVICFASALFVFIVSLVFAEMSRQENYFPRPWMNYLSWSYGFNVLSGFFLAFSGICLFIKAMILKDKLFEPNPAIEKEMEPHRIGGSHHGSESADGATSSKVGESFV